MGRLFFGIGAVIIGVIAAIEIVSELRTGVIAFYWDGFFAGLFALFFLGGGLMVLMGQRLEWHGRKAGITVAGTQEYGFGRPVGAVLMVIGIALLAGIGKEVAAGNGADGTVIFGGVAGLAVTYLGWLSVSRGRHLWKSSPQAAKAAAPGLAWVRRIASVVSMMLGILVVIAGFQNESGPAAGRFFMVVVGAFFFMLGCAGLQRDGTPRWLAWFDSHFAGGRADNLMAVIAVLILLGFFLFAG